MTSDLMGTKKRTPTNGLPFYCSKCGAGWNEYVACEMPDCELESEADAQSRVSTKSQT